MKKLIPILLIISLFVGVTGLLGADKIVGTLKSIVKEGSDVKSVVVNDGKADQTVTCTKESPCDVKAGVAEGAKVTVEVKPKGKVIRKAVAGC
ncbi:MAG: hypothetical protein HQK89_11540 [Nitrospirae bacterium]|nr:hypothetical protein [Nitrospirota bacterium]